MMTTHNEISQRAREIWEREGRPEGRDKEHWLQAESELREEALKNQTGDRITSSDPAMFKVEETVARENGIRKRSARRAR
jgi:hypothetical protein